MASIGLRAGCSALVLCASVALAERPYVVTDLGTLGGGESRALDVNASGWVTGRSRLFVSNVAYWHAYLYDGALKDLETLVGPQGDSWGYGINDAGQAVGWSKSTSGWTRAFRWTDTNGNGSADPGEMVDLGAMGGFTSAARAVNSSGQVAGTAQIAGLIKYEHAFRWTDANGNNQADPGEMADLGTLTGSDSYPSHAWGINDAGAVVGQGKTGIQYHAFYWSDAGGMIDLGTLGGSASHAYDVNNGDEVVGVATTADGHSRAFRWYDANHNNVSDPGEMSDLGTLGGDDSAAYAMNDLGEVVGYSQTAAGGFHAYVYRGGSMTDLNDAIDPALGWELQEAWGISDNGHVVGLGSRGGTPGQAFLLTPAILGDANVDRIVDVQDFSVLKAHFGQDPAEWGDGNFNDDTVVDTQDFSILKAHFGEHLPEPASAALLLIGSALLAVWRRGTRR